ncbi:MAG: response regulator [Desulfobacterales bacterium]|nr:response regulator [Desulfobacterales bacterium]
MVSDVLHDYVIGFSLDSIITLIEQGQETWTLKVRSDGRVGFLYFRDGEIIASEAQGLRGDRAAIEVVSWENPEIQIVKSCNKSREIHSPMMHLLLEGNRVKDEVDEGKAVERAKYKEAVAHIEGFRFKEGQTLLLEILNQNRRLHRAWLWYSRSIGVMKNIGSAISLAKRLAPEDEEVLAESQRFELVKDHITDEKIKRCPYCWTPLPLRAQQCLYCGLYLMVCQSSLVAPNENGNAHVLDASVKRFSNVLEREKNVYAAYYLALSHHNMNDVDRTLELLEETTALSGNNPAFVAQRKLYTDWLKAQTKDEELISDEAVVVAPSGRSPKILVVEDSSTTRKVISMTLGKKGYRIVEAVDGLEALSCLSEGTPDLVLLDIILPKMNGYELLSIIRNRPVFRDLPVIMLTSKDGFMSRVKGKMGGASAYLTKPFNPSTLLETIERHLE